MTNNLTSVVTATRSGGSFNIDVTSCNLSEDLSLKDFQITLGESVVADLTPYTKTTRTILTYSGPSIGTNVLVTIRRNTPIARVQPISFGERLSSSLYEREFNRTHRLIADLGVKGLSTTGSITANVLNLGENPPANEDSLRVPSTAWVNDRSAAIAKINGFRLSNATRAVPWRGGAVSLSNPTVFLIPYTSDNIALHDGTQWQLATAPAGASISVAAVTANRLHDVYAYLSGSTVTLELVAWTSNNLRAINTQITNGVIHKTGDITRRYLGIVYVSASNNVEMSSYSGVSGTPAVCGILNTDNRLPFNLLANGTSTTNLTAASGTAQAISNAGYLRIINEYAVDATAAALVYNSIPQLVRGKVNLSVSNFNSNTNVAFSCEVRANTIALSASASGATTCYNTTPAVATQSMQCEGVLVESSGLYDVYNYVVSAWSGSTPTRVVNNLYSSISALVEC